MSPSGSLTSIALNSTGASAGPSSANKDNLASTPFGAVFSDAVGQIDALETQARTTVDGLITGGGVDVHQAVISTQKAEMAFELALSVRNKALQAYQSVMGMQF
jgi:flagellar hook-basal body complex protein FliE